MKYSDYKITQRGVSKELYVVNKDSNIQGSVAIGYSFTQEKCKIAALVLDRNIAINELLKTPYGYIFKSTIEISNETFEAVNLIFKKGIANTKKKKNSVIVNFN